MTTLDDRPQETTASDGATPRGGRRGLRLAIVGLAIGLVLAAWMVVGRSGGDPLPAEVEGVMDDYVNAWESEDIDALEAVTTGDYVIAEVVYGPGRDIANPDAYTLILNLERRIAAVRNEFADVTHGADAMWDIEQIGTPLVHGDGPWVLSVEEIWSDPTVGSDLAGLATYVVLDVEGTLQIDKHYWAGVNVTNVSGSNE